MISGRLTLFLVSGRRPAGPQSHQQAPENSRLVVRMGTSRRTEVHVDGAILRDVALGSVRQEPRRSPMAARLNKPKCVI